MANLREFLEVKCTELGDQVNIECEQEEGLKCPKISATWKYWTGSALQRQSHEQKHKDEKVHLGNIVSPCDL